jgi:hypothetical protein
VSANPPSPMVRTFCEFAADIFRPVKYSTASSGR